MTVSRRTFLRSTTAAGAAIGGGALFATTSHFGTTSGAEDAIGSLPLDVNGVPGSSEIISAIDEFGLPAGQSASLSSNQGFMSVLFPENRQLGENTPATVTFNMADGQTQTVNVSTPDEGRDDQPLTRVSNMVQIPEGAQSVTMEGADTVHLHDYADGIPTAVDTEVTPYAGTENTDATNTAGATTTGTDAATNTAADAGTQATADASSNLTAMSSNLNSDDIIGSLVLGGVLAAGAVGLANAGKVQLPSIPGVTSGPSNVIDGLNVVSRAQWGADESLMGWTPNFKPAQLITIHHTAMATTPADDYAPQLRSIYRFHASSANGGRGWGDIGYHLLIAPNGVVYQGRSTGDATQAVFSRGSTLGIGRPQVVTAGHVYNVNDGNIGVCLMGDFTNAAPTAEAVDSLVRVLGHLCRGVGLDPRGGTQYNNDLSHISVWRNIISGHRDWGDVSTATSCPGNSFYPQLGSIRNRV